MEMLSSSKYYKREISAYILGQLGTPQMPYKGLPLQNSNFYQTFLNSLALPRTDGNEENIAVEIECELNVKYF